MTSLLLRTTVFVVLMPAAVVVYVPWAIISGTGATADGPLWIIGAAVIVIGAVLLGLCFAGFIVEGRGTPAPYDPPRNLVTGALYQRVRNPIYVAVLTILAGEAIAFASWPLAFWLAFMAVIFHLFVVLYEEPGLRERFDGPYEDYLRRVPRWIPRG